jgi:hypothetical protein
MWRWSALKTVRVSDHDMLHADRHPIRVFDLDDLVMLIGPDTSVRLLGIGVAESDGFDHADQLAERFVKYDPVPGEERPVEEYLLQRAALARARSERDIVDAITAARSTGVPWQGVGELLGTSAQAAQQRYGSLVDVT